jgi:hypothetical protein
MIPMKRLFAASLCAASLALGAPLAAQDGGGPTQEEFDREMAAMGGLFGDMFGKAEALTPEQEARLPAAQSVVLKLFPEGTYAKMMDETMRPMMDAIMGNVAGSPALMVMELTGLAPSELEAAGEERIAEALTVLDPNARARMAEISDMTLTIVSDVVVRIEPSYRSGLARAYAVRFTADELADLDAYFSTPVGRKYAAESFLIFADPQVMSAMNEMMPAVMEAMPGMMGRIGEIAETFPPGRTFSQLTPEEQYRVAQLLGTSVEALAESEPQRPETRSSGDGG